MKTTGIILAGGKSTRMGTNKALLDIKGRVLIERVARVLERTCDEILIAGGDEETYGYLGYTVTPDIFPGCGPLSGIHAGLTVAAYEYSFVAACDIPYPDEMIIRKMIAGPQGYDVVMLYLKDHMEPLFSLYNRNFKHVAAEAIALGIYKVIDRYILDRVKWKLFPISASPMIFDKDHNLTNINTPGDLNKAKKNAD